MMLSDHNAYCQPPCQVGCPTHIDIPGYLELIAKGQNREAARLVKEVLPFPYILGLTCPAPCQEVCRRGAGGGRDRHLPHARLSPPSSAWMTRRRPGCRRRRPARRSPSSARGPAGLTCAYYLALKGHYCKVYDMMPQSGGMLRYGIPEYRLEKDMMDKRVRGRLEARRGRAVQRQAGRGLHHRRLFKEGFDAVYLAIGAGPRTSWAWRARILPGVVNAIAYLMDKTQRPARQPVNETKEVVVLGGGFTTFDCTRTSLRLGAKVHTVYRRGRGEMGATFEEVEDGENEGTDLQLFAAAITHRAEGWQSRRRSSSSACKLGEPDASGRRRPVPIPGSEYVIKCDTRDPGLSGRSPTKRCCHAESGVKWTKRTTIETDPYNFMTARKGVFAGGDCQIGASTIIQCVAQGKLAARSIDAYLRGEDMAEVSRAHRGGGAQARPLRHRALQAGRAEGQDADAALRGPQAQLPPDRDGLHAGAGRSASRAAACSAPAPPPASATCRSTASSTTWKTTASTTASRADYHDYEFDMSHSFILRDPNKCINCTQCVRVCHDVIGPNCYGMFGHGFDTIVSTPFNVSLHATDCVSCGACVQVCPTGSLMMAERELVRWDFALDRCIFCGDCVEVCPHGALGETPNFELSFYNRFGRDINCRCRSGARAVVPGAPACAAQRQADDPTGTESAGASAARRAASANRALRAPFDVARPPD